MNRTQERLCTAHTSAGAPCKRHAILGGTVCPTHGGRAPQVRDAARRRLLAAVDPIMTELIRIALSADSEAVRVQAAKDLLDRAGLGAKQLIEQTVTVHDGDSVDREIERLAAELARRAEGRTVGGTPMVDTSPT